MSPLSFLFNSTPNLRCADRWFSKGLLMPLLSGGSAQSELVGRQAGASLATVPTLLQALSASESTVPQLIIESASPCQILLANRAWCALTGYASEDVVGNSVSLLHGPLTCRETLTALGLAMASGRSLQVMLVCYGKSSRPCLASISALPLLDAAGLPSFFQWSISGFVMLDQDATQQAAAVPCHTVPQAGGSLAGYHPSGGAFAPAPAAAYQQLPRGEMNASISLSSQLSLSRPGPAAFQHLSACNANLFTSHQQHGQSALLGSMVPQPGSCASSTRVWAVPGGSVLPGRGPGH